MQYVDIGTSGVMGSEIALGCMHMHEISTDEVATLISTAHENGINFYDHADIYGGGECEEIFGNAFGKTGLRREDVILQTKSGIHNYRYDFSKEHILETVHDSLRRLKTDYIDILLLHRPDALMEPEEIAEAFDLLHNSGKVRNFGVSNHHPMQIMLLTQFLNQRLITNQLQFSPAHTGMVDCGILVNTGEDGAVHRDGMLLDYCRLNQMTVQAWSPYQYRDGDDEYVYLGDDRFKELTEALHTVGQNHGLSDEAAVTAWILRHPAHMQVLVGTTKPDRLQDICKASGETISREEWYDIYMAAGNKVP